MRRLIALAALAFLAGASPFLTPARAQVFTIAACGTVPASMATLTAGNPGMLFIDTTGKLCSAASVSATVTGFAPGGNYANLTATASSADVTLPTNGGTVVAYNTGTTAVSCNLTVGAGTSTANKDIIQPSSSSAYTVGSNTHISCIDQTGSASNVVVVSGGSGLATGWGGGGGSGGGAVSVADGADVTLGAKADVAAGTGTVSAMAIFKQLHLDMTAAIPDCAATPCTNKVGNVYLADQYPAGAVRYTASATGTTGATTATLAGAASVTTYICGFSIRANATAAATGNATVTGTITGTLNFTQWTAPNASGVGVVEQIFSPCVPASGTNQSVAVVSAAPGTGGVVSVTAWGYKL